LRFRVLFFFSPALPALQARFFRRYRWYTHVPIVLDVSPPPVALPHGRAFVSHWRPLAFALDGRFTSFLDFFFLLPLFCLILCGPFPSKWDCFPSTPHLSLFPPGSSCCSPYLGAVQVNLKVCNFAFHAGTLVTDRA